MYTEAFHTPTLGSRGFTGIFHRGLHLIHISIQSLETLSHLFTEERLQISEAMLPYYLKAFFNHSPPKNIEISYHIVFSTLFGTPDYKVFSQ